MLNQNISIIAVIDDDSPNPEIVGLEILSVASKEDPELPEVKIIFCNDYSRTAETLMTGLECEIHGNGVCHCCSHSEGRSYKSNAHRQRTPAAAGWWCPLEFIRKWSHIFYMSPISDSRTFLRSYPHLQ